jgi:hypothetical protein
MSDREVSKFSKCDKNPFLVSSGFIMSRLTCSALGQLCSFKVIQHAEIWTLVNFMVSWAKRFHHGFNMIKVLSQPIFFR